MFPHTAHIEAVTLLVREWNYYRSKMYSLYCSDRAEIGSEETAGLKEF
jgi:hypothetical protein